MGLLTPVYYNQKKSYDERSEAIEKEKSKKRLQSAAKDPSLDGRLRAVAIKKLRDPSLCEAVLMELVEKDPLKEPNDLQIFAYKAAARSLTEMGEQSRLERIFHQCGNYGIQSIVVSCIENPTLLEEAAINSGEKFGPNPWYTKVAQSAVSKITDDAALARVTIHSFHPYPAMDASKHVRDDTQLLNIALHSPYIEARIVAVQRMSNPESIIMPLREELMPAISEDPMNLESEAILLALCGDTIANLILYFTGCEAKCVREGVRLCDLSEALKADPEILLPVLKKILETLLAGKDYKTQKLIPRVAKCIRLMHENNIAPERIESDFPQTIQYEYEYRDYAGDDYDSAYDVENTETIVLW